MDEIKELMMIFIKYSSLLKEFDNFYIGLVVMDFIYFCYKKMCLKRNDVCGVLYQPSYTPNVALNWGENGNLQNFADFCFLHEINLYL